MNGKVVCGRNLVVHFAEEKVHYRSDAPVEELVKSALGSTHGDAAGEKPSDTPSINVPSSASSLVTALKAKLAQMEREKD